VPPRGAASFDLSDASSYVSTRTVASITSTGVGMRCFVWETIFKLLDLSFVLVGELTPGVVVVGTHGPVTVLEVKVHPEAVQHLVEIMTKTASLTVTISHRVIVQGGLGHGESLAGDLQPGMVVMCGAEPSEIIYVKMFKRMTKIVEIRVQDDAMVEAYPLPRQGILTRGKPSDYLCTPRKVSSVMPADDSCGVSRGGRYRSMSPRGLPLLDVTTFCPWSIGTMGHNSRDPEACQICWHYKRNKRCAAGTGCTKCHAPHRELPRRIRSARNSARSV